MEHVEYLCGFGLGGVGDLRTLSDGNIMGLWYHQPEPDYLNALKLLNEFSDVLGQRGKDWRNDILGPVVGVSARWTEIRGEAVVEVLVRNAENVTVSIKEKQGGSAALVVWPVTFRRNVLSDHRTHRKTFLVSGLLPHNESLSVVAGLGNDVLEVADFWIPPTFRDLFLCLRQGRAAGRHGEGPIFKWNARKG